MRHLTSVNFAQALCHLFPAVQLSEDRCNSPCTRHRLCSSSGWGWWRRCRCSRCTFSPRLICLNSDSLKNPRVSPHERLSPFVSRHALGFHAKPVAWYFKTYSFDASRIARKALTHSTCLGSLTVKVIEERNITRQ